MVDVSRVSQNVRTQIEDIGNQDGKKGITSKAERDQLAQLLANGEITGYNAEYAQEQITKFDFEKAKEAASDFVKDTIKNIMKMGKGSDKNKIDTRAELAALDAIINDPNSSPEDVAYAKAVRQQSEFAVHQDTLAENAKLRGENEDLRVENKNLKTELGDLKEALKTTQEELDAANNTIDELQANIENLKGVNKTLAQKLHSSISKATYFAKLKSSLGEELTQAETKLKNGDISENDFQTLFSRIDKKAREYAKNMQQFVDDCWKTMKEFGENLEPEEQDIIDKSKEVLTTIGAGMTAGVSGVITANVVEKVFTQEDDR